MNKPLWELELSTDIKERQFFVQKLKERIKQSEAMLAENDPWDGVDREVFIRLTKSEDQDIAKLAQEIVTNMEEYYASDPNARVIQQERSFLAMLKNKLDNFDVYNQQIKYVCGRCKETKLHCVCDELNNNL